MARKVIIGSRGSDLALWQAHFTKNQLEDLGHLVEIVIIKTRGDQIQHLSFDKIEGKGFFTKELEEALLAGEIDLAVHSHKDLPTTFPPGLTIAGVSYREDCSESLLIRPEALDESKSLLLKKNARIGTSSFRRRSQLLSLRNDLKISDLRGNVPTRVDKLRQGNYDAIVLASAGLNRLALDLSDLKRVILSPHYFVPAPAQGVLAFQIREEDVEMKHIVSRIHHEDVQLAIAAERSVLNQLDGGCLLPLGVFCQPVSDGYRLWASLQPLDGTPFRRVFIQGKQPDQLAQQALHVLTRTESRQVFISREAETSSAFIDQVRDYGFQVRAFSPLQFEPIEIRTMPLADWVFFSSPRSVQFFYDQHIQLPVHCRIAALGSGTLSVLNELGLHADFIGSDEDTNSTGIAFSKIAHGKTVVFPCAEQSLRSIQIVLEEHADVHDLPVYRTSSKATIEKIDADIWVFTSPSSVEALQNQFDSVNHTFVAIGQSTAAALYKVGVKQIHIAPHTNLQSLADLVCGL